MIFFLAAGGGYFSQHRIKMKINNKEKTMTDKINL